MPRVKITELVRRVLQTPSERVTDYRDPRVPGFVLRARPFGIQGLRSAVSMQQDAHEAGHPEVAELLCTTPGVPPR
jgi:hypothetical protein